MHSSPKPNFHTATGIMTGSCISLQANGRRFRLGYEISQGSRNGKHLKYRALPLRCPADRRHHSDLCPDQFERRFEQKTVCPGALEQVQSDIVGLTEVWND